MANQQNNIAIRIEVLQEQKKSIDELIDKYRPIILGASNEDLRRMMPLYESWFKASNKLDIDIILLENGLEPIK